MYKIIICEKHKKQATAEFLSTTHYENSISIFFLNVYENICADVFLINFTFQNVPTPVPSGTSGAIFPISSGITPAVVNQNFCQSGLDRCCPVNGYSCGIRYPPIVGSKAPTQGQAVK